MPSRPCATCCAPHCAGSGFEVHTAADDAGAVTMAGSHPPNIMVLDVVLADGIALARTLRADDGTRACRRCS